MESALHFISPELLDVQVSGTSARRNGNVDPDCAPHDAFPCAGDDEWCAIAVETDEQWRALRGVLGDPGVGAGPGARHRCRPPRRGRCHRQGAEPRSRSATSRCS